MRFFNFKTLVSVFSMLILSACLGGGGSSSSTVAKGKQFDGVWSGQITLQIGDDSCMRRENFILRITDGYLRGKTRDIKYKTEITGYIEDNGEISGGQFKLGTVYRDAEMLGKFEEGTAAGTWESRRCKGKWTLRRIQ